MNPRTPQTQHAHTQLTQQHKLRHFEEITISEGASDLCDGTDGGCDVDVTITKMGVVEDDVVLRNVDAYAAA